MIAGFLVQLQPTCSALWFTLCLVAQCTHVTGTRVITVLGRGYLCPTLADYPRRQPPHKGPHMRRCYAGTAHQYSSLTRVCASNRGWGLCFRHPYSGRADIKRASTLPRPRNGWFKASSRGRAQGSLTTTETQRLPAQTCLNHATRHYKTHACAMKTTCVRTFLRGPW